MGEVKVCPVCGSRVTGRSDKVYCSDGCRVHAHNEKRRASGNGCLEKTVAGIHRDLAGIAASGGVRYIKIIGLLTRLYKKMHTFGK